ncbi:hypothetical protein RB597_005585 [Gaeumannomyces tritici]
MEYPIDKVGPVALLVDHSRQGSPKVDWRLLVTQEMLSESIRWLAIARELERRRAQTPTAAQHGTVFARLDLAAKAVRPVGRLLGGALLALWRLAPTRLRVVVYKLLALWRLAPAGLRAAVLALWRLAPARLRVVVYKLLTSAGRWLYGEGPAQTQRLPFGLYLKKNKNGEAARNEFNALKIVRRYTSIPVPVPLDLAIVPAPPSEGADNEGYMLTTHVPGRTLAVASKVMLERDRRAFARQMQVYLQQLRAVPNTANQHAISNSLGGPIFDPRINGSRAPLGPFRDEAEFNRLGLAVADDPARAGHAVCFTHAGLNAGNVLLDYVLLWDGMRGWRVTGIVDWEISGFFPEYWEFTKCLFEQYKPTSLVVKDLFRGAFQGNDEYEREHQLERECWYQVLGASVARWFAETL